MSFSTPILYLAFNRPRETAITFNQLKELKPYRLYIAQDGPRTEAERDKTDSVSEIIKGIDWNCNAHYLIRSENLGCREAVNTAIDWFFQNENMGIILEDDILVNPDFFEYCALLLKKYEFDKRIMMISGNNLLGSFQIDTSYFFSSIGAIWGWATWKRVWEMHDQQMSSWPKHKKEKTLYKLLPKKIAYERERVCELAFNGKIDTWDYQFTYSRIINKGLTIIPSSNLIQNIGFSNDATHTLAKPHYFDNKLRPLNTISIHHPKEIIPNLDFDQLVFNHQHPKVRHIRKFTGKLKKFFLT